MPTTDRRVKADDKPLYVRAHRAILKLIEDWELEVGSFLPSEAELAKILNVGRSTVREAMMHLEHAGLVQRTRGRGTVLTNLAHQPQFGLERIRSLESIADDQGWHCGTEDVLIDACVLTGDIAQGLQRADGTTGTQIVRTKTRDGAPMAVMETWIPQDVVNTDRISELFQDSTTGLLQAAVGVAFARTVVSAVACGVPHARRLGVRRGIPLVTLTELYFSEDPAPIAYNINLFLPDSIRLDLLRRP